MKYPLSYYLHALRGNVCYGSEFVAAKLKSKLNPHAPLRPSGSDKYYSDFLLAINDACEFLKISLPDFIAYFGEHARWPGELWTSVGADPEQFNRRLTEQYGRYNICANTICSFSLKRTYDALAYVLDILSRRTEGIRVCDYGCCNANISFSMLLNDRISYLAMCDFYSESTALIAYRINKYRLEHKAKWHDVSQRPEMGLYDVVYCIDVLEHATHPSEILEGILYPLLKSGGFLVLQAPWGGGVVSHLDEAVVDFYTRGGRRFLARRFKKIRSLSALDVSGVWIKR